MAILNDALMFHEAKRCLADGDAARAEKLCDELTDRIAEHVAAWRLMADAQAAQGRADDAEASRRRADEIEGEHLRAAAARAFENRSYAAAAEFYSRAWDCDPDNLEAVWGAAESLHYDDRNREALPWYERYAELKPGNPEALHMIASIGRRKAPERASPGYVSALFDNFAESFDELLTGELEYKAPDLLFEAVRDALPADADRLNVLDLGCGTGLSGIRFRPLARRLQGVDLSREMIRHARRRGIYDSLRVADLVPALDAFDARLDVAIACDVLIYLGDLAPVFAAAARALAPGGIFAATTEFHAKSGYALGATGRYRHGDGYVRECADAAGLVAVSHARAPVRLEQGEPVEGAVSVFRRPL